MGWVEGGADSIRLDFSPWNPKSCRSLQGYSKFGFKLPVLLLEVQKAGADCVS